MHRSTLLGVLGLVLAAPVFAQSAPAAPRSHEDSLAIGRKIVDWVYESQTDSLWNRMGPDFRAMMTDKAGLQQRIDQVVLGFGTEIEIGAETVAPKNGNILYIREVRFDGRPADWAEWAFEVAPDGTILTGDLRPKGAAQQAKPDSAATPAPAPGTK